MTYEDGTDIVFRNFCTQNVDAGDPKVRIKIHITANVCNQNFSYTLYVVSSFHVTIFNP